MQLAKGWKGVRAYANSKLCNVLFTRELARRLKDTHVTVNVLHPGVVASGFGRNAEAGWMRAAVRVLSVIPGVMINAEKGAQTSIWAATDPSLAKVSGRYFDKRAPVESSKASGDDALAQRLWEMSEQMTGIAAKR